MGKDITLYLLGSAILLISTNLLISIFFYKTERLKQATTPVHVEAEVPKTTLISVDIVPSSKTRTLHKNSTFLSQLQFPIVNGDLCSRPANQWNKLSLLIVVISAIRHFSSRQAIRQTWGSIASSSNNTGSVRLGFLLGLTEDTLLQQKVIKEQEAYVDIVQGNFIDSYRNLSLKSLTLLKWVDSYCPNAPFVLKTDDDTYVNVKVLLITLPSLPYKAKAMYGRLFEKVKPIRNPSAKWFISEKQYPGTILPNYLSGTGYVMSRDVIDPLLDASANVPLVELEDIYITGLCASEAGIQRYNTQGFEYKKRAVRGCAFKGVITGHHVTAEDMAKIHRELKIPDLKSCVKKPRAPIGAKRRPIAIGRHLGILNMNF